jgi:predicted component of type VI protein secretion system
MSYTVTVRDPEGKLLTFRLDRASTTVGRSDDNDIQLPYPFVSGRHLRFEVAGRTVFVHDLGSANGTRLGGEPLEAHVPTALLPGQVLEVGSLVLRLAAEPERTSRLTTDGPAPAWSLQEGLVSVAAPELDETAIRPRIALLPRPSPGPAAPVAREPGRKPAWLAVQIFAGLSAFAALVVLIVTLLL